MISDDEERLINIDNKVDVGINNINRLSISKDEKLDMELVIFLRTKFRSLLYISRLKKMK